MARMKGTGEGRPLQAVPNPGDSFKGYEASEGYDPTHYYVRSIDPKIHGDSTWRRIRFPSDIAAEVDKLMSSGMFAGTPITSFSALVRDALVHRLHHYADQFHDPLLNAFLTNERAISRVDSLVRDRESKKMIVDGAVHALEGGMAARDRENVKDCLTLYEPMIENLREPYKQQLEEVCKRARRWLAQAK